MLSQYSWWDLTKIVLVALIIYYAYVLWTYYREDIRDWWSNRGQKPQLQPENGDPVDDEETDLLYTISKYMPESKTSVPDTSAEPVTSVPEATPVPEAALAPPPLSVAPATTPSADAELTLRGLALPEENPAESDFALTMSGELERPQEEPLSTFMKAAGRLQATDDGNVVADDPSDKDAQNLAQIINQQQGRSALAGFTFTR